MNHYMILISADDKPTLDSVVDCHVRLSASGDLPATYYWAGISKPSIESIISFAKDLPSFKSWEWDISNDLLFAQRKIAEEGLKTINSTP
tara:strand:- start:727 stop:996 length:270 start_codon:yes stop_codon:yes gene_type:complete